MAELKFDVPAMYDFHRKVLARPAPVQIGRACLPPAL